MLGFHTYFCHLLDDDPPEQAVFDDPRPGWRVGWGSHVLGLRFAREKDAAAAIQNLVKNGITPFGLTRLETTDTEAWTNIYRLCLEALQW